MGGWGEAGWIGVDGGGGDGRLDGAGFRVGGDVAGWRRVGGGG